MHFRYLHKECMTPIKYYKYCSNCDLKVEPEDIVLGYEYQKGRFVVMEEEDLLSIPLRTTRTIDILDFVELAQVDPMFFDKSYYLEPAEGGEKAYALLLRAMASSGKAAIAKVVIRTKETLAAVRVYRNLLLLETMFYPDEIRDPAELNVDPDRINLNDNEIEMALMLINNLARDFDGERYHNEYRQALREVIESKVVGQKVVQAPAAPKTTGAADLMEALKASVELARQKRPQRDTPPLH